MEKNMDVYIRRLIELDDTAVKLKAKRDAELLNQGTQSRYELKSADAVLEEAAIIAKQKHDEIINEAKLQVKEMDEAARVLADELQTYFSSFREDAAKDIWKQLLYIER